MTPQTRAEKCAALMWANDAASQKLGMSLDAIAPGSATLSMPVRDEMLNGLGMCHGGMIFTLADSALAFASNSYNVLMVAQQVQITYVAPAKAQEMLTATACEIVRTGRSGTYDVTITGKDGHKIALLRGLTRSVKGQHFDEDPE
ncbi:hydroxyphenylacetyl-CoA thioesterase PaaI [Tateyamaria pelophila]|uniref:hydroxyphenylacetyl-CoA thioesterase PaaI n=1 Tax=Tateyamaria pelophila TaxID=328415 RepID=UPI001CBEC765|nr:hydroxyphenylacetyl-CoA thioesterase PaaI [Tateyamaria pelophila]